MRDYVETHSIRKLQLGTGPNLLEGWLNTDLLPDTYPHHRHEIFYLDATKRFPFEDKTFDYIFSEHQIEHISERDAHSMARECFRVMRPGARIRIATPDLANVIRAYNDPFGEKERHYVQWIMSEFRPHVRSGNPRCYVVNHIFTDHKHKFIYDYETLSALLEDAGFLDVERFQANESNSPQLRGLEMHGAAIGDEGINAFESLVVEAARPSEPASEERVR